MVSLALSHHAPSLLEAVLLIIAPPRAPRRLIDVAKTIRITEGKYGPRPEAPDGDFLDLNRHPGQRAVCRLVASGKYRVVVHIAPPQDGKDTGVCAPLFIWAICELRRPVAYCTTDLRLVGKLYRAKIQTAMKGSEYANLLPTDGLGSGGGTPDEILFNNGVRAYLLGSGASNGAGQAGVTAWLVIITEADKIRALQREWLQDRNKSYDDERQSLLTSTLETDGGGGLWDLYEQSTKGRLHLPCRHCGAFQPIEPEQVEYDPTSPDTARETAHIVCRVEGCKWNEDDRKWSVANALEVHEGQRIEGRGVADLVGNETIRQVKGHVIGQPISSDCGGVRTWALDSPFRSLPEYAASLRKVKDTLVRTGDHKPLQAFTRAEQVRPYINREETLELRETDLALRSANAIHARGQTPDSDIVTVGIDQQLRRFLFVVLAYRITDENWHIIDYGFKGLCPEAEDPTDAQAAAGLDHIRTRVMSGYTRANGLLLKPQLGFIDTADGNTIKRALAWIKLNPGFYAARGERGEQHSSDATGSAIFRLPGTLTVYRQTKTIPHWDQFAPDVDALKGDIMRGLGRKLGDGGAGFIPKGEGSQDDLIQQLCAERLETTTNGPRWVQKRRHNHYLDCTAYALAGARYLAHLRTVNNNCNSAADYVNRITKGN